MSLLLLRGSDLIISSKFIPKTLSINSVSFSSCRKILLGDFWGYHVKIN